MKHSQLLPGVLAMGVVVSLPGSAQEDPEKSGATTPPIEIPAEGDDASADPEAVKADSSYGLGYRTGGEFGQQYGNFGITPSDLDMEKFMKGFLDGFEGGEPEVSEEKLGEAMQAFGDMLQAREQELAEENLQRGQAFLEENAGKDGVTTTDSGLQYRVLEEGGDETYVEPKEGEPSKQFMVHYRGTLIDGTEFDASAEGEPVPMDMNVIEGVKEALTTMPVGAKWELFIPSELAYGEQRRSAEIGPNSALIFELELEDIQDAPAANGGMPFQMPEGHPQPGQER